MTELPDKDQIDLLANVLTDTFMRLIDGHPCVVVGAAMGFALQSTIENPEALSAALNALTLAATTDPNAPDAHVSAH